MLQAASDVLTKLHRTDPGGLRFVRGIHLMLTVLACVALSNGIAALVPGVSAFKLSVLSAAAGGHCLIFTPVSTKRQEISSILRLAGIVVLLFGFGAIVGTLAGKSVSPVLQALWVAFIALGFALDGLTGFWQRAGRMIAILWLFVVMGSQPVSPGLWLPAMAVMGAGAAFVIRIGLWRPSTEATYLRVDSANRKAMSAYLLLAAQRALDTHQEAAKALADLADLRMELKVSADLLGERATVRGLSPEAATMIELALEVVRDASAHLSEEAWAQLQADPSYDAATQALAYRIEAGEAPKTAVPDGKSPDTGWSVPGGKLSIDDQVHILRIAQAFRRLWILAERGDPVPEAGAVAAAAGRTQWWQRLSWRLALQAGVAAAIGYGLGAALQLSHAYWVTLTVIIILCNSLGTTVQKTIQRTLGTAAGVLVAMAVDPLLAGAPDVRLVLVTLTIPVVIVFMDRNYTVAAGFISFLVVVGLQTLENLPLVELWARLYDTMLGAAVGLGVAWGLFPKRTGNSIRSLTGTYLKACADYLKEDDEPGTSGEDGAENQGYVRLRTAAAALVATATAYRAEQAPWSSFSSATNRLDILAIVLADYVVLYRQARSLVTGQVAVHPAASELQGLVARMDKRVEDEIDAVLSGQEKQTVPGLIEDWMAAVPDVETASPELMTDWVAMLYHARKVIRCLDGLRQEDLLPKAAAPVTGHAAVSA
ncbi:FUSC family protein [Roseibium sp. M-1]